MIYAEILSAGVGSRMGATDMPKQFLSLGGVPIIIHTIEKFMLIKEVDKIIIVVSKKWISHTEDLIKKYIPVQLQSKILVCEGGKDRNESVLKGIRFIRKKFGISSDDIVVTHDAVRPFVTDRIIKENIQMVYKYGATDTVIPSVDTIVESVDGKMISNIPNRSIMYQGQTPQSFNILEFEELYCGLTEEEKNILTDCAKIFQMKKKRVALVRGESFNIKITAPYDFKVANLLVKGCDIYDK